MAYSKEVVERFEAVIANPNPTGENTTANCLEIKRTGAQWWILQGIDVDDITHQSRVIVENYLKQELNAKLVPKYLEIYDKNIQGVR